MAELPFPTPFAANGPRRAPSPAELDQGFPCGDLDLELFNGLFHDLMAAINEAGTGTDEGSAYAGDFDLAVSGWQTTPPANPAVNSKYVVKTGAVGAWQGQVHKVAVWRGTAGWQFVSPMSGLQANFVDAGRFAVIWFNGAEWRQISGALPAAVTTTFRINANGQADFINLTEAFNFLRGFVIPPDSDVILQVQSDLTEPAPVNCYHNDGNRISIYGPAMKGAFPSYADYSGNLATDQNMLRSRFGATIACAVSLNVLNIIGGRLREIRDLAIIGKRTGTTQGTVISVGETDITKFNRIGQGGVYLNRVACHGSDINVFLRQTSDITFSDLATSGASDDGIRVANNSFAGAFSGRLVSVYNGRGVQCRDGSTFETNPANAEIRKNTAEGMYIINQSHCQCDGAVIRDNGTYNVYASCNSSVLATNAQITAGGIAGGYACDRAYIDFTGSSLVSSSPAFNTNGNNGAYVKKG